jgi:mercuric ion binding protein
MIRYGTLIRCIVILGFFAGGAAAQVTTATVEVKGMSCPFCAFGVEKRLGAVAGVEQVVVSMKGGSAELTAATDRSIDLTAVPEAVRRAGFTPGRIEAAVRGTIRRTADGFEVVPGGGGKPLAVVAPGAPLAPTFDRAAHDGGVWEVRGRIEIRGDEARLRATAIGPAS